MSEYPEETLEDVLYTFPKSEYETRYERARQLMAKKNLDAIMVTDKKNVVYFTGYHNPQYGLDKIRRYVFILPIDGDPTFLTPNPAPPFPWVPNLVGYQYSNPPKNITETFVPKLVETIRDIGLNGKKIGCELGRENWLWMSYLEFVDLQSKMPNTKFVDGAEALLDLMVKKSDLEVYFLRKAATATARGALKTFEEMVPGMTERDLTRLLRINILKYGADSVYRIFTSSGHTEVSKRPLQMYEATLRKPKRGEQIHFDMQAEYRYYICDFTRDAFLGYAHPKSRKMWEYMRYVHKSLLNAIEPGLDIRELPKKYLALAKEIKMKNPELGQYFTRLRRRLEVDRMGHGSGLEPCEYPCIGLWETGQPYKKQFLLEPGMIFSVNPAVITDKKYGEFNTEENVVVTENGFELLSEPGLTEDIPIYPFV